MYPDWVSPAVAGFLILWLGILTYYLWKESSFLKSLFPKSGERDIRHKFEEVLEDLSNFKGDLGAVKSKITELEKGNLGHIHRVKLLRFNPFDDTGGNMSFVVALLDNLGNGVVVSSLHGRSGTRIFAKGVREGKADKNQFSKEEITVIKEAMK